MPYCCQCGKSVGNHDAYCGVCGARQAAAASMPPMDYMHGISPRTASLLCYIPILGWIVSIVVLASARFRTDPRVRFHAFQCIGIAVVWFVLWIVVAVASMMVALIPGVRMLLLFIHFLYVGLGIAVFILWLMAIIKASKGEWFKIPFIGDFAMKMAQSSN